VVSVAYRTTTDREIKMGSDGSMGNKKGETVSGQAAWQKCGEFSPEEAAELKQLQDRLKAGEVLSYKEQDRLFVLKQRQKQVTHVE